MVIEFVVFDGLNKFVDLVKKLFLIIVWGMFIEVDVEYFVVGICKMKFIIGGVFVVVMIDDGFEFNIIFEKFWDLVNVKEFRGLRIDIVFRVNGILGVSEVFLGSVVLFVILGGIIIIYIFWVGFIIKKVILGMFFVYKNKIDIYWVGECRVVR